ncbi:hypothetical protein [Streptomyces sp. NRRL B-1347]|uniref:hypothetical protein n=1 Tax=Streptomyces sp. NRRL B-1347 TaxID=1476877 RepID=UPI00131BFFAF|nr:hypothetical protein [Streptomyces sp. NRRL B-1347]
MTHRLPSRRTGPESRGRRRGRTFVLGAVLLLTCTAVAATTGEASSASTPPKPVPRTPGAQFPTGPAPDGFATWSDLFTTQQRLNAKASKILTAARTAGHDNPVGVVAAPKNRALRVYWHGTVPDGMRRQLGGRAGDVPVEVLPARYSNDALRTAVRGLKTSGATSMAVPRPDGSGVVVRWAPGAQRHGRTADGVPVTVAPGAGPQGSRAVPLTGRCADGARYCREDDTTPYYAGARLSNCTVGWPLRLPNNTPALLTAGHCGAGGATAYDGGGDAMGGYGNHSVGSDHATIGAAGSGRMWDGNWQNSTFTKPIGGRDGTYVGNHVCTSGSRSGALCGFTISFIDPPDPSGAPGPSAYASENTAQYGPGQGDSGGPVFSLSGDGQRVFAVGTVTSGANDARVPCRGENWPGRVCAWHFRFDRVDYALSSTFSPVFGSQIVTG